MSSEFVVRVVRVYLVLCFCFFACGQTSSVSCVGMVNGTVWDLSGLTYNSSSPTAPSGYSLQTDSGSTFYINFCEQVSSTAVSPDCNKMNGSGSCQLSAASYYPAGNVASMVFQEYENQPGGVGPASGVAIAYSGDSSYCNGFSEYRSTVINIGCDEQADPGVLVAASQVGCSYTLYFNSKFGCARNESSVSVSASPSASVALPPSSSVSVTPTVSFSSSGSVDSSPSPSASPSPAFPCPSPSPVSPSNSKSQQITPTTTASSTQSLTSTRSMFASPTRSLTPTRSSSTQIPIDTSSDTQSGGAGGNYQVYTFDESSGGSSALLIIAYIVLISLMVGIIVVAVVVSAYFLFVRSKTSDEMYS